MAELVRAYDYTDETGRVLYQNVRFEPKDFRIRRPDGMGGWAWGRDGTAATLYRLPELVQAPLQDWVCITEGEKDCDNLRALGWPATTSGGVSSWRPEFAPYFENRLVAIFPDNDEPGRAFVKKVVADLIPVAGEVRIVDLPSDVKDVSEYLLSRDALDEQAMRADLQGLIERAPIQRLPAPGEDRGAKGEGPGTTGEGPAPLEVLYAADLLEIEPPEADQILAGLFDKGDKAAIIGSSKLRKSFFLLQAMMSLAAGRPFMAWGVPKPRRVCLIQLEIRGHHFHRRLRRMAQGLGIVPADLEGRLFIVNGRGLDLSGEAGMERLKEVAKRTEAEIVCIDPLYKAAVGKENAAEDLKIVLGQFDRLAEDTGAAVLYIHHDRKGFVGEQDPRDRGAGSNVLGRDYDAALTLTGHAVEEDAIVVETLTRNYRGADPFVAQWTENPTGGYCFEVRPDLPPTKKTSATARAQDTTSFELVKPMALGLVKGGPLEVREFKSRLRAKAGLTRERADRFVGWALSQFEDPLDVHEVRGRGRHAKYVGTPEQIQRLREEA